MIWAWFTGPIGKWVLIGAVVVSSLAGWTTYHRVDAARKATAACQLDALNATIDLERNRAKVAEGIADTARNKADVAQTEIEELEALTREIINDESGSCVIPDDLRERLLRIN